jgi:hypothetical protein
MLGAAGVDFTSALFKLLGPAYVARLMRKTGAAAGAAHACLRKLCS